MNNYNLLSSNHIHTKVIQYRSQGGPEDIAYKNCKEMIKLFDAANVKYQYSEAPGGHTWHTWRNNLYDLAQKVFK